MTRILEALRFGVLTLGTLLFVDLFLPWHHTSVSVAGSIVDVESDSSAWAGWGAVAGVLLIALLAWEAWRLTGAAVAARASAAAVSFVLAVFVAAFTLIEFATGAVDVHSGGLVVVGVHGRQWPGYVGVVLAALIALVALIRLELPHRRDAPRVRLEVR